MKKVGKVMNNVIENPKVITIAKKIDNGSTLTKIKNQSKYSIQLNHDPTIEQIILLRILSKGAFNKILSNSMQRQ